MVTTTMYRVQYLCPRQSPYWQDLTESFLIIFRQPRQFLTLMDATEEANRLMWKYHSARVIDEWGREVYSV